MKTERIVLRKRLDFFEDVNDYFKRLSGNDMADIPAKYGSSVEDARDQAMENLEIGMVYQCDNIETAGETEVVLECRERFTGDMPGRILKDAGQVVSFVVSLCGYGELAEQTEDIMEQYFLDTWGSAYVEAAQGWLGRNVLAGLKEEGMSRTHLWSPGQHQFALSNQKALFRILKPEDIGCRLTGNLMMVPVKSASGIMGIVPEDVKDLLLPCDFCPYGAACPASKRGCAEL